MRAALMTSVAVALLSAAPLAQSPVPRAANGKPDLSGVWQAGTNIRGSWEEANSGVGLGGNGSNPNAGGIRSTSERPAEPAPYQPWAAKKVIEFFNRRGIDDPQVNCYPPGIPRLATAGLMPIQFVQTQTQIIVLYENMNVFRIIPLNVPHPNDVVSTFMGDSVGRWEGDTLVVDVIGFNDKTWLQGTGTFHTDALHVTERYTRMDKDQINYEATMEDPNVFTKPWTIRSTMMLREGTRVRELVCAENNQEPRRFEKYDKEGVDFRRPEK